MSITAKLAEMRYEASHTQRIIDAALTEITIPIDCIKAYARETEIDDEELLKELRSSLEDLARFADLLAHRSHALAKSLTLVDDLHSHPVAHALNHELEGTTKALLRAGTRNQEMQARCDNLVADIKRLIKK